MKLFYLFLVLFNSQLSCYAQDFSLKVDSIKIYHLPLNLRTSLALTDFDVRNWKENVGSTQLLKTHVIADSAELQSFVDLDIVNNSSISEFKYSLDPRIIIDIYLSASIILTISMDDSGYFYLGNEKYQRIRNRKIISWLNKYIPELK
jgi:hypothetical protein